MEHWNRGWGVAYKGDMKVESGMEWNTGMEPGGGGGDGVGWAWNRIRLFQVKLNSKRFYTVISILFVGLFHWNVDRDSSPRQKAIPVLFWVFPLDPLVLCVTLQLCACMYVSLCCAVLQAMRLSAVKTAFKFSSLTLPLLRLSSGHPPRQTIHCTTHAFKWRLDPLSLAGVFCHFVAHCVCGQLPVPASAATSLWLCKLGQARVFCCIVYRCLPGTVCVGSTRLSTGAVLSALSGLPCVQHPRCLAGAVGAL
jgi:hypothetical protein